MEILNNLFLTVLVLFPVIFFICGMINTLAIPQTDKQGKPKNKYQLEFELEESMKEVFLGTFGCAIISGVLYLIYSLIILIWQ